jgi:hypothetical protein
LDQRPRQRLRNARGVIAALSNHELFAAQIGKLVKDPDCYFFWCDDLESDASSAPEAHFRYYRELIDRFVVDPELRQRCFVHFFVNMREAYFLADAAAMNAVLGTSESDHDGDVEHIVSPKGKLSKLVKGLDRSLKFDEKVHGAQLMAKLNLDHVLEHQERCKAMRTFVAWCWQIAGEERGIRFCLTEGWYWQVTAVQLIEPIPPERAKPIRE